jgi:glycerophosphoryl diester phosphodiesterase
MTSRRRLLSLWIAASLGSVPTALADPPARKTLPPYKRPTLIAHRGASAYAPEHVIAAYELAIRQGADFVEPDLQMTKDGRLVCLHDAALERTTDVEEVFPDRAKEAKGRKVWPVADFTLAEIKRLDAGKWKDAKFAGARVPTLEEMIRAVKGRAGIIPETKSPAEHAARGLDMERALLAALAAEGLDVPGRDPLTPVIVQSFSEASLRKLRHELGCKLPLVYLVREKGASAAELRRIKQFADGVAPVRAAVLARPQIVADAHALGMSVTVWTFRAARPAERDRERAEMKRFLKELSVDALFTDNPDLFPRD